MEIRADPHKVTIGANDRIGRESGSRSYMRFAENAAGLTAYSRLTIETGQDCLIRENEWCHWLAQEEKKPIVGE